MKTLFLGLLMTFAFASCTSGSGVRPADVDGREALLRSLYSQHNPSTPEGDVLLNETTLSRYFSGEVVALLGRDAACRRRTHELCALDFDPILDAQDFEETTRVATVGALRQAGDRSTWQVTFENLGARTLTFELRQGAEGARVTDIIYPDGRTLTGILSRNPD